MNTRLIISKVRNWLRNRVDMRYKYTLEGSILPQGYQTDGTSCGICVASTIASATLASAPWTHETRKLERIGWVLRLADNRSDLQVSLIAALS